MNDHGGCRFQVTQEGLTHPKPWCSAGLQFQPAQWDEGTILPALCWIRPFAIVEHLVWFLWSGYVPFAWFGSQKSWEHGEDLAQIPVTLPLAASSAELSPTPGRENANSDMSNFSLSFSAWTSFLIRAAKNNLCLLSKCCSCKIDLPLPT